jgi:hypothetical protein
MNASAQARGDEAASRLVPLGETGWHLWPDAALRGAGFPARDLEAVRDDALAAAADALDERDPASRERYADAFAAAAVRLGAAVRRLAVDGRFREAVTWQNPALLDTCLDKAAVEHRRNVRGRNHELTIVSLLQRYTLKNDSIGFFGPIGWARVGGAEGGVGLEPGTEQLSRRTVYFERWAIEALADALAAQPEFAPWLRPRMAPSASLIGWTARMPFRRPVTLTAREMHLLRRCDGEHTVRDLLGQRPDPRAAALFARLREEGLVELGLVARRSVWPERELAEWIDSITDPGVRAAARRPLDELLAARAEVAAAAGRPDELRAAVRELALRFEKTTGAASSRLPGATYAGRTLIYEDAVRGTRVELGAQTLEELAGPLGLLLESASWLAEAIARRYLRRATELYEREATRTGERTVPFLPLLTAVLSELAAPGAAAFESEPVREAVDELQRRWLEIVGLDPQEAGTARRHSTTSREIAESAKLAFAVGEPLFANATCHSPDLMIAAPHAAGSAPGGHGAGASPSYILGELHCASNTLESLLFAAQHPDPERLRALIAASAPAGRVFLIPRTDSHQVSTRMSRAPEAMSADHVHLCLGDESQQPPPGARTYSVLDLVVARESGRLVVRPRSGGAAMDFLETIGEPLSSVCAGAFRPFGATRHTPRITIDRLVVARESWTFPAAGISWAFEKDEARRFAAARAWRAGLGLPEQAFFRVPVERKPLAVDFRSIPMVNLLGKAVRRTAEAGAGSLGISEMLPDLDELWLNDAAGGPYTAELRLVAVRRPTPAGEALARRPDTAPRTAA